MVALFGDICHGCILDQRPRDIDPGRDIYGEEIAARFADEAYKTLKQDELEQLRDLLIMDPGHVSPRDKLHKSVARRLQMFYEAEMQVSGEDRNRLACPSGPEDADLGLIVMHCQSKDGEVGPFWDMTNASIQALTAKGLSEEFTFCYDWHWRAERSPSVEVYVQRNPGGGLSRFYTTIFLTIFWPCFHSLSLCLPVVVHG